MSSDLRPLDGGDEQIERTGNGPENPRETEILKELFGEPDGGGVYAPYNGEYEEGDEHGGA